MTKILIADDNKQITSVLMEYAKKEGYSVEIASDGAEAIENLKVLNPIHLLDVMMPRMDGFEVCRDIRRDIENVPIIMVTARGEDF